MSEQPQTWHHGLIARWWAEFNEGGPDVAYYQTLIEQYGQSALDVACGTGRLLLPYVRAGLDVDGCDVSADMLALCAEKAAQEGLAPRLYQQPMHELDLPRRYKFIYMAGSFGLGGQREQDMEALRRIHAHLEPGGVLAVDKDLPYDFPDAWSYWVREKRAELPEAWPEWGKRRRASDGTDYQLRSRLVALDPFEQRFTLEMWARRWQGEELLAEEKRLLRGCIYFKNEMLLMLEKVGFRDIVIHGDYQRTEATAEHKILTYIARK